MVGPERRHDSGQVLTSKSSSTWWNRTSQRQKRCPPWFVCSSDEGSGDLIPVRDPIGKFKAIKAPSETSMPRDPEPSAGDAPHEGLLKPERRA